MKRLGYKIELVQKMLEEHNLDVNCVGDEYCKVISNIPYDTLASGWTLACLCVYNLNLENHFPRGSRFVFPENDCCHCGKYQGKPKVPPAYCGR